MPKAFLRWHLGRAPRSTPAPPRWRPPLGHGAAPRAARQPCRRAPEQGIARRRTAWTGGAGLGKGDVGRLGGIKRTLDPTASTWPPLGRDQGCLRSRTTRCVANTDTHAIEAVTGYRKPSTTGTGNLWGLLLMEADLEPTHG